MWQRSRFVCLLGSILKVSSSWVHSVFVVSGGLLGAGNQLWFHMHLSEVSYCCRFEASNFFAGSFETLYSAWAGQSSAVTSLLTSSASLASIGTWRRDL